MSSLNVRHYLNIEQFIDNSVAGTGVGLLRPNKYMCLLNSPPSMSKLKKNGWLEWNVISVECPNISVSTEFVEVNSWVHYYLKTREDSDLSITFHEDSTLTLRRFFYDWINEGFNQKNMSRRYIDDVCATEMKVVPLMFDGVGKYCDKFEMVFPYEINSLDYDLAAEDSVLKTTVKFKYRFHTVEAISASDYKHTATHS